MGILFLTLGVVRFSIAIHPPQDELAPWRGKSINISGIVLESWASKNGYVLQFLARSIIVGENNTRIKENILIFLPLSRPYKTGDELLLRCVLSEQKNWPTKPPRWMCSPESIRLLGKGSAGPIAGFVYKMRVGFLDGLAKSFSEPELSLAKGLLLGNDFGFSLDLYRLFVRTGTAHIVAVSGWNITIITSYVLLSLVALGFARRRALPILLCFILFYVLLTGSGASAVRAGIMGVLAGVAWQIRRPYRAINAVFAAASLMILINPRLLVFDLGFILSFAATAGLLYFGPFFKSIFPKKISAHFIRWSAESLAQGAAATLATFPVILLFFGNFSLVAPIANLLMLPMVPLATILSFATGISGMLNESLGRIFAFISWLPISYIISVAEITSRLPFANFFVSSFWGRVLVLAMPIVVIIFVILLTRTKDKKSILWRIEE